METPDIDAPSGKQSQTSYPPPALSNHIPAEARILRTSLDSCSASEKPVEDKLFTSGRKVQLPK